MMRMSVFAATIACEMYPSSAMDMIRRDTVNISKTKLIRQNLNNAKSNDIHFLIKFRYLIFFNLTFSGRFSAPELLVDMSAML